MKEFPGNKKIVEQFKKDAMTVFPKEEKQKLWESIEQSIRKKKNKKHSLILFYTGIAAGICLFIISGYFLIQQEYKSLSTVNSVGPVTPSLPDTTTDKTVKIITASGEELLLSGEEPTIIADNYNKQQVPPDAPTFNQLVVPTGKKSILLLEDGTRLWVNSDTKVIYPDKFKSDKREITVDGEIYADVVTEKDRPFIVKTKDFRVRVTGTAFNLSAYADDVKQSVILVCGKVEVDSENFALIALSPHSMLSLTDENIEVKKNINVYDYICWKDNLLVLDATAFSDLATKLNRHYDCQIILDQQLNNRKLSGKLDLKNSLEDVIKSLSISLDYSYTIDNNIIRISSN